MTLPHHEDSSIVLDKLKVALGLVETLRQENEAYKDNFEQVLGMGEMGGDQDWQSSLFNKCDHHLFRSLHPSLPQILLKFSSNPATLFWENKTKPPQRLSNSMKGKR